MTSEARHAREAWSVQGLPEAVEALEAAKARLGDRLDQIERLTQELEVAQAENRRLARELRESNEDLKQFAYIVSHDLTEPLRMVTSYLGLLERRYSDELDDDAEAFIDFARSGADRMDRLLKGLLAYSRVGTHGQDPAPVDSRQALQQALDNLQLTIEETGAEVHVADEMPAVLADEAQLVQLFQNLVSNAIKFTPDERTPRIEISSGTEEDIVAFHIEDNGIGIDPGQADRIFQVFQRLHGPEEYEGTGMGLAICKRVVDRHGGEIRVASTQGQGSTFTFTMPWPGPDASDGQG